MILAVFVLLLLLIDIPSLPLWLVSAAVAVGPDAPPAQIDTALRRHAETRNAVAEITTSLIVLALGCALTPFMDSSFGMMMALGVLSAAGSGAGSFSVLIGAASRKLDSAKRGQAAGIINAGGSLGQFVFAPLAQKLITTVGWMGAMYALAIAALAALPLAPPLRPVLEQLARPRSASSTRGMPRSCVPAWSASGRTASCAT